MVCIFGGFVHASRVLFKETHDFSSPMRATQMVLGFSEWILEFSSPRGGDKALVVNPWQAGFYTSTDLLDFHPFLGGWYLFYHKLIFDFLLMTVTTVILENSFRENKELFERKKQLKRISRKRFRSKMATRKKKSKYTPFIILTNKIYYKLVNWKQRNWKKNSNFFQKTRWWWNHMNDQEFQTGWFINSNFNFLYFIKTRTLNA